MINYQLDTDLLNLLPPWYREILDYQQICQAEKAQFDLLADEIINVADNFYFQTMDAGAVSQWEQIFGIIPNTTTETLDFRRIRVLNRISTRPPFTLGFLYQKLDELIGQGQWTVYVDYPNYTLYIESSAENQQYATEVSYTINRIKPAHIVYVNTPYLSTTLLLSETIELSQLIYNYKLGAWGLGVLPFAGEQEQGVIKMATTPSIQQALLNGTASFISSDIAKARINGTIDIDDLNKSVSANTLTLTYTVTQSQTEEITLTELLDESGNILTSSTIYVPVTQNTIIKHTIPVLEGVTNNG